MEWVWFGVGFFLGGFLGVALMSLMVAAAQGDEERQFTVIEGGGDD